MESHTLAALSNKLPEALFVRYQADPLGCDEAVRQQMGVPEDRYYTVSIWPVPGLLRVDSSRTRAVRGRKISKSEQRH